MKDRTPFEIAKPIVAYIISELLSKGFTLAVADDGEESHDVSTVDEALDVIFSVDESSFCVKRDDKAYWVEVIGSNGEDCIHDWNSGQPFNGIMGEILDSLEHFRCPRCASVFPSSDALVQVETVREPGFAPIEVSSLACAGCESDDIVPCKAAPQET